MVDILFCAMGAIFKLHLFYMRIRGAVIGDELHKMHCMLYG
jgi:hypothetical protein